MPAIYTAPIAAAPAAPPSADWWRGFGAPDLDRLIATAQLGSPDVQAAAARIIQADQAARVAGSPLLPGVTGNATQNWQRTGTGSTGSSSFNLSSLGPQFANLGKTSTYTESRSYSAELSASYEIDFWGKNLDSLRAAEALAKGSRYDAQTVWLTTVSSIANTYFQALGYRDRLRIAEHNLKDAAHVLDAYRARLSVGTADLLDVSQQEALVAGYRATLPSLESQYRQEVIALAILVGLAPEKIALGERRLTDLRLPAVAAGLPATLLRRRPDVAYAEAQLISQNQTVRQDVANFYPSLTLTASGGLSSLALSTITGPGTVVASLMSQLTPDDFRQRAEIRHAGRGEGPLPGTRRRLHQIGAASAQRRGNGADGHKLCRRPGIAGGGGGAHGGTFGRNRARPAPGGDGGYRHRAEHGNHAVQ